MSGGAALGRVGAGFSAMNSIKETNDGQEARRWCEKGRDLADRGRHKEAVAAFATALKRNPELADAYFLRAASYYQLGRYVLAGCDLDAAALLGCRDAQFWSRYESGADDDPLEEQTARSD
jgi:tetratricopeptide (TPR) repeat protein